ncbi:MULTISPECIES: hypothetical protein [unclassified Mesorhizobium]|uniref:hypothetical protein n=1 Tax=unclassified Mesorhizobium TaxID=325217 RepID=UPI0019D2196A|nr:MULTISPECIES: hypothetical protein [unclassified Mesorhizobium]
MNTAIPDLSSVTRLPSTDKSTGDEELDAARREARKYLEFYDWVSAIKGEYFGYGADGIIYIFLFEIVPGRPDVAQWIWVIVGDVPPTYIPCDDAKNPYEALDGYIGAMEEWVEAARQGKSVAKLIPVNVPANPATLKCWAAVSNSSTKRFCRNFESDVLGSPTSAANRARTGRWSDYGHDGSLWRAAGSDVARAGSSLSGPCQASQTFQMKD